MFFEKLALCNPRSSRLSVVFSIFLNTSHAISNTTFTMSITCYLFLLFLCISTQSCNARHLSTSDKKMEKSVSLPSKEEERNDFLGMQTQQLEVTRNAVSQTLAGENSRKMEMKIQGTHNQSLVTVSWRVPHKKHGEKNPGFNLDYAPPKTHPPSHN